MARAARLKFARQLPNWERTFTFVYIMRVIAVKTLKHFWEKHPEAEQALLVWYEEAQKSHWESPNELKAKFRNASILGGKRVVFNIHGNTFRLIVDIEFKFQIVFVVWVGTHKEYDKIDAKTVQYAKAN